MSGQVVSAALGILALLLCEWPGCGHLSVVYQPLNGNASASLEVTPAGEMKGPIFVHIGAKEIAVPCKPAKTDLGIDRAPTYNWTLENGETHSLHGDAYLILHKFRAEDSGRYACTITYMDGGQPHTKTFSHTLVGYYLREELHILLIFQSNSCDEALMQGFLRTLHEHLSQVVSHFHCQLLPWATTCFPTLERPLDEFNLQLELKVSPFGKDWDESCNSTLEALSFACYRSAVQTNLQQAKKAMTRFMEKNKHFPLRGSVASRASFTNTFINFLEGGKCQKGYGLTQELQAHCPDCCTLCSPGTHSVAPGSTCVLCPVGTYSLHYGAATCILCPHNWVTSYLGASRIVDCMKKEVPPAGRFSELMVEFALPPLGCLCLIVLLCYCFRRRWQKRDSSASKNGQASQQNEATAAGGDTGLPQT